MQVRKDGIRLFLLWYQILNENASEECREIFLQLVPGLGNGIHQDSLYGKSQSAAESKDGLILMLHRISAAVLCKSCQNTWLSNVWEPNAYAKCKYLCRCSEQQLILCMLFVAGCSGMIMSGDITPILPGSGEKLPDNITKHYFDALLYYMVSEVWSTLWFDLLPPYGKHVSNGKFWAGFDC